MATLAEIQARRAAIQAALASPAAQVNWTDGRGVRYRSREELLAEDARLAAQEATLAGTPAPTRLYRFATGKGLV